MEVLMKGNFNKAFVLTLLISSVIPAKASLPHFDVNVDEIVTSAVQAGQLAAAENSANVGEIVTSAVQAGQLAAAENSAAEAARAALNAGWIWKTGSWIVNGVKKPFAEAYKLIAAYPKTAIGLGLAGAAAAGIRAYAKPVEVAARQVSKQAANVQAVANQYQVLINAMQQSIATKTMMQFNDAVQASLAKIRAVSVTNDHKVFYAHLMGLIVKFDTAIVTGYQLEQSQKGLENCLTAALKKCKSVQVQPTEIVAAKPVVATVKAEQKSRFGFWSKVAAGLGLGGLSAYALYAGYFKN